MLLPVGDVEVVGLSSYTGCSLRLRAGLGLHNHRRVPRGQFSLEAVFWIMALFSFMTLVISVIIPRVIEEKPQ